MLIEISNISGRKFSAAYTHLHRITHKSVLSREVQNNDFTDNRNCQQYGTECGNQVQPNSRTPLNPQTNFGLIRTHQCGILVTEPEIDMFAFDPHDWRVESFEYRLAINRQMISKLEAISENKMFFM